MSALLCPRALVVASVAFALVGSTYLTRGRSTEKWLGVAHAASAQVAAHVQVERVN